MTNNHTRQNISALRFINIAHSNFTWILEQYWNNQQYNWFNQLTTNYSSNILQCKGKISCHWLLCDKKQKIYAWSFFEAIPPTYSQTLLIIGRLPVSSPPNWLYDAYKALITHIANLSQVDIIRLFAPKRVLELLSHQNSSTKIKKLLSPQKYYLSTLSCTPLVDIDYLEINTYSW